jgi:non-structural maintenance of chromosomes element 1
VANDKLDIVHSGDKAAWDTFVGKINDSLDSLDFEFRHLNDEVTGREMYALVKPFSLFLIPYVKFIARP